MVKVVSHPSLAFVKYWGFIDERLFLPLNPSIAMNLDGFYTTVEVEPSDKDEFYLNGTRLGGKLEEKPRKLMEFMRERYGVGHYRVYSESNIPTGTGIASSSASMSALAAAVLWEEGIKLDTRELSTVARVGSGSAARSVPGNYSEWLYGETHEDSYARVVFPKDYWDLRVVTFIISKEHKKVSSWEGHKKAGDYNMVRVKEAWKNWWLARTALEKRDIEMLGRVIVDEMNGLMAVAISSDIIYFEPKTLEVLREVNSHRGDHLYPTMDAGPTVHVITTKEGEGIAKAIAEELGVEYVISRCGDGVRRV